MIGNNYKDLSLPALNISSHLALPPLFHHYHSQFTKSVLRHFLPLILIKKVFFPPLSRPFFYYSFSFKFTYAVLHSPCRSLILLKIKRTQVMLSSCYFLSFLFIHATPCQSITLNSFYYIYILYVAQALSLLVRLRFTRYFFQINPMLSSHCLLFFNNVMFQGFPLEPPINFYLPPPLSSTTFAQRHYLERGFQGLLHPLLVP